MSVRESTRLFRLSVSGGRTDVRGPQPLGPLLDLEIDDLTLLQLIEVQADQTRPVEEDVLAVVAADESESAVVDELRDSSSCHTKTPL